MNTLLKEYTVSRQHYEWIDSISLMNAYQMIVTLQIQYYSIFPGVISGKYKPDLRQHRILNIPHAVIILVKLVQK